MTAKPMSPEEQARELHDLIADPHSNADACVAQLMEWRDCSIRQAEADARADMRNRIAALCVEKDKLWRSQDRIAAAGAANTIRKEVLALPLNPTTESPDVR